MIDRKTPTDRLLASARLAANHLPAHMRKDFEALFAPETLAITVGVLGGWAAAHAFGVGFAADILLLVVGFASLGFVAFQIADALKDYVVTGVAAQSDADLDKAGQHLARAVSLLGVQTFVALITRGAHRRIMAQAAYPNRVAQLDRILRGVGTKTHIPEIRQRVFVALGYLEQSFPKMSEQGIISRLKAIDFHKPVEVVELPAGTRLVAYRQAEYILMPERLMQGAPPLRQFEPLLGGTYYAPPGTPADRLGIATGTREIVRFQTKQPIKVLKSTAAPANDTWTVGRSPTFPDVRTPGGRVDTGERVAGGGTQFIIPDAKDVLEIIGSGRPRL